TATATTGLADEDAAGAGALAADCAAAAGAVAAGGGAGCAAVTGGAAAGFGLDALAAAVVAGGAWELAGVGTIKTWPTRINSGSSSALKSISEPRSTFSCAAMSRSVSPALTS